MQLQTNDRLGTVEFNDKTLFQVIEDYAESQNMVDLPFEIPRDEVKFYDHFGHPYHDSQRGPDGLPTKV